MTWETATIDDIFPMCCDKCGTVVPLIRWVDSDGRCPICDSPNGKVLGEFVEEGRSDLQSSILT
jgi:hypothetical protein